MDLRDAFDRAVKKQKLSEDKEEEVIDGMSQEIEIAAKKIIDVGEVLGCELKTILAELQAYLNEIGPDAQIGALQKELNVTMSKYGKALEKAFHTDIARAYREVDFDPHIVNQIIAGHFYRRGQFELGDCFAKEAQESVATLKAPFVEMHKILEQVKLRNLDPALIWAKSHRDELLQKGSSLEFELHQLQFVQLLQQGLRPEALEYARSNFVPFASLHMEKIQRLMGGLLWAGRLEASPYLDLLPATNWEIIGLEFTRECCSLLNQSFQSPLQVTISAGAQALPTFLKMVSVLACNKQDWQGLKELPVEINLGNEYQFHSFFSCPVSKEYSTADNPPMLMPCGHVLCKQSLQKVSKNGAFKCPYCPIFRLSMDECKPMHF